jgi:hypothetical protein
MLLLGHLLRYNAEWRDAELRVLSLASNEMMKQSIENSLARFLPDIRIPVEVSVMLRTSDRTVQEVIHEHSADADIVFLGLNIPDEIGALPGYAERLQELAEPLRTVFFVKNSSPFVGQLIQTTDEQGHAPEIEADSQ